ncbi:DUF4401 domain-containing protein [Parachitinimonas caeni]|uniref:DUF4401 domain-containing protein n=1 Tax=Parachitinimonas caeni TaxID=3031301 RepID=A0ABT7DWH8_9NEIS|nr:DUF4401 domain-containing protein [Parachitinimonas caeni]MDK2124391.1 DUF4401 domain-containing protein [Parachitinimonas caeni]
MSRITFTSISEKIIQSAIRAGYWPENAKTQFKNEVRVIAGGAAEISGWLIATLVLCSTLATLRAELLLENLYLAGSLLIVITTNALQKRPLPWLIEQLVTGLLLIGVGLVTLGVFRDLPERVAPAFTFLLLLGIATLSKRPWLQWLFGVLGAISCALISMSWRELFLRAAFESEQYQKAMELGWRMTRPDPLLFFLAALYTCLGMWLINQYALTYLWNKDRQPQGEPAPEYFADGWLTVILTVLAIWASLGSFQKLGWGDYGLSNFFNLHIPVYFCHWIANVARVVSVHLCVAAMILAIWRWPVLRKPWWVGVALPLLGAAWLIPSLGIAILILSQCITSFRKRQAVFAGLVCAWSIINFSFYSNFSHKVQIGLFLFISGLWFAVGLWVKRNWGRLPSLCNIGERRKDIATYAAVYALIFVTWGVYSYPYESIKIRTTDLIIDELRLQCQSNSIRDSYVGAKGDLVVRANTGLYRWDVQSNQWKLFFTFNPSERAGQFFPLKNGGAVIAYDDKVYRVNEKGRIHHAVVEREYRSLYVDENGSAYVLSHDGVTWTDDWHTWVKMKWPEETFNADEVIAFKDGKIYASRTGSSVFVLDKKNKSYTLLDSFYPLTIGEKGAYVGSYLYLTAHRRGEQRKQPMESSKWMILKIGLDGRYSSALNFGMGDKFPKYMKLRGLVGDDIFFEADRRLYLSRDGGKSAVRIGKNLELNKEKKEKRLDIWGIAKGPDGTLYATRSDAVYKSTDYGMNWTSMGREGIPAEVCS